MDNAAVREEVAGVIDAFEVFAANEKRIAYMAAREEDRTAALSAAMTWQKAADVLRAALERVQP